ncbi:hypothetical protein BH23GEM9_BH23GEM9_19580 [soil metagenome]
MCGLLAGSFLTAKGTQTVRVHHIESRPHIQGESSPLRLRHSSGELTDGGGLLLIRRLWDQLGIGTWLEVETRQVGGRFRSPLMVEVWVVLLLYGGGSMDDLKLLGSRGIRRLFGWVSLPDPTTFGRWLRRSGETLVVVLDRLLWLLVQRRWQQVGTPRKIMVVLDSTVVVRYGKKQAGAEVGYNPKKQGRPSHHPLVAFSADTGDCLGVMWRPGSAHTAAGSIEWLRRIVARLRGLGVHDITVRMDKGFFSKEMVQALVDMDVRFFLKVPRYPWVRSAAGAWRASAKDANLWTATSELYGVRLLACEWRVTSRDGQEGQLPLDSYKVERDAFILSNDPTIHALTAWRTYNEGALVEQRIEELGQLAVGRTAVDDIGGNKLLWALGALAYQLLHIVRTTALSGSWRKAQPARLRVWLFRMPGKLTRHARKTYVQLVREEPQRKPLLAALRSLARLRPLSA